MTCWRSCLVVATARSLDHLGKPLGHADMYKEGVSNDHLCPESGLSPFLIMTDNDRQEQCAQVSENEKVDSLSWLCQLRQASHERFHERRATHECFHEEFRSRQTHSPVELLRFLQDWGGGLGPNIANFKLHSLTGKEPSSNRTWHDPTRTPLPHAPNLRIYCIRN